MKTRSLCTLAVLGVLLVLVIQTCDGTLSKKASKKDRNAPRPPGVAYNNKKYPTKCHVCRLMVEEIQKTLKGESSSEELTEEQKKEKKRKDRRKSRAEKKREKAVPMLLAIEEVCDKMLIYVPQEEDRKKFRYVKQSDLKDTKSLIESQVKGETESQQLITEYERFRHPESNRLMEMCDELLNKRENELMKWNSMEEKDDLMQFLCRERILVTGEPVADTCLTQSTIRDSLWTKAFDAVFEKHPELKEQKY